MKCIFVSASSDLSLKNRTREIVVDFKLPFLKRYFAMNVQNTYNYICLMSQQHVYSLLNDDLLTKTL